MLSVSDVSAVVTASADEGGDREHGAEHDMIGWSIFGPVFVYSH